MDWDEELKQQVDRRYDNLQKLEIDLAQARTNYLIPIAGDFLKVESLTDPSAAPTIKFSNKNNADTIPLKAGRVIKTTFPYITLSNIAQAGESMTLLIGIHLEIIDEQPAAGPAQPVDKITHASADTNVTGADQPANRAVVKADVKNTGIAWIDFDTAAVQDECFPLDPGESLEVAIYNLNRINANFEVAGEKVFVVYE